MRNFTFEIEYSDGYIENYTTLAANRCAAYEMLTEYLRDCCVDPRDVKILNIDVESEKENDYGT